MSWVPRNASDGMNLSLPLINWHSPTVGNLLLCICLPEQQKHTEIQSLNTSSPRMNWQRYKCTETNWRLLVKCLREGTWKSRSLAGKGLNDLALDSSLGHDPWGTSYVQPYIMLPYTGSDHWSFYTSTVCSDWWQLAGVWGQKSLWALPVWAEQRGCSKPWCSSSAQVQLKWMAAQGIVLSHFNNPQHLLSICFQSVS